MTLWNGDHVDQPSPLREIWQAHAGAGAAYTTLREAILVGYLRHGDQLAEEQLARECGVSRTPIREAIFRLEAEHFAIRQVRRGLIVKAILHWIKEQIEAATQQAGHANVRGLQMVRQLHDSARRFGVTTFSLPGRASVAIAEHRAILEAIDRGNAETAGRLAAEHLTHMREARIALIRNASVSLKRGVV